jgi:hypothetical protein
MLLNHGSLISNDIPKAIRSWAPPSLHYGYSDEQLVGLVMSGWKRWTWFKQVWQRKLTDCQLGVNAILVLGNARRSSPMWLGTPHGMGSACTIDCVEKHV